MLLCICPNICIASRTNPNVNSRLWVITLAALIGKNVPLWWERLYWLTDLWESLIKGVTRHMLGSPGSSGEESACQCRRAKTLGFDPWVEKIPWMRKWQLTPIFLSGQSHGQRSLGGCNPQNCKELNTTECAQRVLRNLHTFLWNLQWT